MKLIKLKKNISKILKEHGLNSVDASVCVNALINAELVGAPSHGLSRLKMYCDRIKKKLINPKPKIKIKKFHNKSHKLMPIIVSVLLRLI